MAKTQQVFTLPFLLLLVSVEILQLSAVTSAIGINYGTLGNLPPPQQVVDFIKTNTIFDSVKIFDANPDILRALAGTGINVTIMVPNGNIPTMVNVENARQWVAANVLPFHRQTQIKYVCVGNEILVSNDNNLISNLVPAMQSLNEALKASGLTDIKVTTPHAFTIGYNQNAPSHSIFNNDQKDFFTKILEFHRQAKSPFMINAYTYFMMDPNNVNYAIFGPSNAIQDTNTQHTYNNMFDAVIDATYSAMNALGYGDLEIAVGETGWPSACDAAWCTPQNAENYNLNIIKRAEIIGTPLMPNHHIDIYIFALFNEDGKPGPTRERNWGLFKPDFSPVYDVGVLKGENRGGGGYPPNIGGKWCVAKQEATITQLQANIDWVCSQGIDCKPISPGGICFDNNNIKTRSSFVMNAYYQSKGYSDNTCDFRGSGMVTTTNPSTSTCVVPNGGGNENSGGKWCMAKQEATNTQLQANIDWVCSQGIDCKPISPGGICFDNNNMKTRSTFVMNAYYQSKGNSDNACDFRGSGIVTTTNPSTSTCMVPHGGGGLSSSNMESSSRDANSRRSNSKWCVAKPETSDTQLEANIDWICNQQPERYINCTAIYPGPQGDCSRETLLTKAAFAMSAYYMRHGSLRVNCEFNGSGIVTTTTPSTWTCFISGAPENFMRIY